MAEDGSLCRAAPGPPRPPRAVPESGPRRRLLPESAEEVHGRSRPTPDPVRSQGGLERGYDPAGSVEPPPPTPPTAMAKHKAPTQVTIRREEKSLMQAWVDRYWKTFAALAVALTAVLLYRTYSAEQARAQMGSEWAPLDQAVREGDREKLAALRVEAAGTPIADWATFAEGGRSLERRVRRGRVAFKALEGTRTRFSALAPPIGPEGAEVTIASHLAPASAAQASGRPPTRSWTTRPCRPTHPRSSSRPTRTSS